MNEVKPQIINRTETQLIKKAFHITVVVAKCFTLMVQYEKSSTNSKKKQLFGYLRNLYGYCGIIAAGALFTFVVIKIIQQGFDIHTSGHWLIYYGTVLLIILQFNKIAHNWNKILKQWISVDSSISRYVPSTNLNKIFNTITLVTWCIALIEYLLWILNAMQESKQCTNYNQYPLETYFCTCYPHVFSLTKYTHWKAFFIQVSDIVVYFAEVFVDLFIVLISHGLTVLFKNIFKAVELQQFCQKKRWKEIREDYNKLWYLCRFVNEYVSNLVLLSYFSNVFYVCIDIFQSIYPHNILIEQIVFVYGFVFLTVRLVVVTLCASRINSESKRPLEVLYSLPSHEYSEEIRMLIDQINNCNIGLSGANLFVINKTTLLNVAGTIITFALMLLQFQQYLKKPEEDFCPK